MNTWVTNDYSLELAIGLADFFATRRIAGKVIRGS